MRIPNDQNIMFKAIDVFAFSLRKDLQKTGYDIKESEIQWVITIPAILNHRSRQFIRVAAEKVLHYCIC